MDETRIAELRTIHRDLAAYLEKQHEAISNCLLTVAALRTTLDSGPYLRKSYEANRRALVEDGTFQPSPVYENSLQSLLKELAEW